MMWMGLFLLAFIALLLVVLLSRQKKKTNDIYTKMQSQHDEVGTPLKTQDEILHDISRKSDNISRKVLDQDHSTETEELKSTDELLMDITNDMIDFLKLKTGKLEIQKAAFNINNVLDEVVGIVSSKARGSSVEFILDIEKNVPLKLIGDPLRLSQMLSRLLSNAMNSTEEGTVKLKIERIEQGDADVMLQFEIIDNGIALQEDRIEEMFSPFSDTNDVSETNLGLYISRELARLMGGDIRVGNQDEKGTTFIITIGFSAENPSEFRHYRLPSKSYTNHKFLIIDHHDDSALALKKMLEYFRHDVTHLSQLQDDLSVLAAYEVVIIDESLFSESLIAVIKEIKEMQPIKIVSVGNVLSLTRDSAIASDVIDRHIVKPFSQQRIMDLNIALFNENEMPVIKERSKDVTAEKVSTVSKELKAVETIPVAANVTRKSFTNFAGAMVMIVEDNVINQKVLTGLLGSSGIRLCIANDGQEALERLEEEGVCDLVLMDINMPVMDGYEATRHIRENSKYNAMPVVSLTGLGLSEEIEKMYLLGMDAHLLKPLQVGALYTVFSRYLKADQDAGSDKLPDQKKASIFKNSRALSAKDGLDRASGDNDLYLEILQKFIELYTDADKELALMIDQNEFSKAQKFCSNIRGVSANIGAYPLSETARQLHAPLAREEAKELKGLTGVFKVQLYEVLDEIEILLQTIDG